jgi:hypothetical protein
VSEKYGEPWVAVRSSGHRGGEPPYAYVQDDDDVWLFDTINSSASAIQTEHDEDGSVTWDEGGERLLDRACDCVNFLAGVPGQKLVDADPQAVAMFLAFLKGDDQAALAGAEDIFERCQNAGYVPRAEIVKANGTLAAMVGKLRKELRRMRKTLNFPPDHILNERHCYDHSVMLELLTRIDSLLDQTKKGDPGPET